MKNPAFEAVAAAHQELGWRAPVDAIIASVKELTGQDVTRQYVYNFRYDRRLQRKARKETLDRLGSMVAAQMAEAERLGGTWEIDQRMDGLDLKVQLPPQPAKEPAKEPDQWATEWTEDGPQSFRILPEPGA